MATEDSEYWKSLADRLTSQLDSWKQSLTLEQAKSASYASDLVEANRRLQKAQTNHKKDIALISVRAAKTALENDWCEVYEELVEDLNKELVVPLMPPERDWEVIIVVTSHARAVTQDDAARTILSMVSNALAGHRDLPVDTTVEIDHD